MELDVTNRHLLETLQQGFPLVEEPFVELGRVLGVRPEEVLKRVRGLKAKRVIREIGAVFNSRALGYQSTLVAISVPADKLEAAAAIISQHPGVSHNYARKHLYNLWFTLSLPVREEVAKASEKLASQAGAESVMVLPAIKIFKIGAYYRLLEQEEVTIYEGDDGHASAATASMPSPTPAEVAVVRELQEDLPLVERPFQEMAGRLGLGEGELLGWAKDFLNRGWMRRFAAILYHRRLGFLANAMVCWHVPLERVEEVGKTLASFPQMTHCYQRVSYPHWLYNLYTIVHTPTKKECQAIIRSMVQRANIADYLTLFSTEEFKKARVKFYW